MQAASAVTVGRRSLELVDVAEQRGAVLLLDVQQEVLVPGVAHQRGVAVAVGDELERLGPAHLLVAGLEVDLLVLLAGGVLTW